MDKLIAIGDIHGEMSKLDGLMSQISPDSNDTIVFLGDYIDRGENSKAVIDFLMALKEYCTCIFLKGNHEWLFEQACLSYQSLQTWLQNGGDKTILDYGNMNRIQPRHGSFFNDLTLYHQTDDYLFVHAGIRPGVPLHEQQESDFLWIREDFLDQPTGLSKTVIHGHTPIDTVDSLQADKINLDTGAVYGGPLTALILPEKKIVQCT